MRKDKVKICQDGITVTTVEIMLREIRLLIALLTAATAAAIAAIDVGLNVGAASGRKVRKAQPAPQARRGCPDPRDRRDPKGYRA